MNERKHYKSMRIPQKDSLQTDGSGIDLPMKDTANCSVPVQPFAEIVVDDSSPVQYAPVPIPPSPQPVMDEQRRIFNEMREMSRYNHAAYFINSKFYQKQVQYENAKIFYKQAIFMQDFTDDYTDSVPFSSYFPHYQMMGYRQLRTYFTWRTKLRNGIVTDIPLSYAFVYIYELLHNVGVDHPTGGIAQLLNFWKAYQVYDRTIEKYLLRWVKDYFIYYALPGTFQDFVVTHDLAEKYPQPLDADLDFAGLCKLSKYKITQSMFYTGEMCEWLSECTTLVRHRLASRLEDAGLSLDQLLFQPGKGKTLWTPFQGALFYPTRRQPDRCVVLSKREVYLCRQNKWTYSLMIPTDDGRNLISYLLKQTESTLRHLTKFRYQISTNSSMLGDATRKTLDAAGICLEPFVTDITTAYYREKTKTVVSVNAAALHRIRTNALGTQKKLIVPEAEVPNGAVLPIPHAPAPPSPALPDRPDFPTGWAQLNRMLQAAEIQVLWAALQGNGDILQIADAAGIMPEVLVDGINEKAFDCIGDNLLEWDVHITIYEEYRQDVSKMLEDT